MGTQHGQCPTEGCGKHGFIVEADDNGEYFVHFKLRHNGQTHPQKVPVSFFQQFINAGTSAIVTVTDASEVNT